MITLDHIMNYLQGCKSKKFDNGKRMVIKMQVLPSVTYKNGKICIHAVSSETERFEGIHNESSIFFKMFFLRVLFKMEYEDVIEVEAEHEA